MSLKWLVNILLVSALLIYGLMAITHWLLSFILVLEKKKKVDLYNYTATVITSEDTLVR